MLFKSGSILSASAAVAAITLIGSLASAAPVTFSSVSFISGPTDVSTTGTLVTAVSFDQGTSSTAASATVNGVTFTRSTGGPNINNWWTLNGTDVVASESFGDAGYSSTYPSTVVTDPNYLSMLSRVAVNSNGVSNPAPIVISNLTPGSNYQAQFWSAYPNNNDGNLAALTSSNGTTADGAYAALPFGSYIFANFTADSTGTQTFDYYATSGWSGINALQVRDLSPAPVPEPGTLALFAVAGLALLTVGRKAGNRVRGNRAGG